MAFMKATIFSLSGVEMSLLTHVEADVILSSGYSRCSSAAVLAVMLGVPRYVRSMRR